MAKRRIDSSRSARRFTMPAKLVREAVKSGAIRKGQICLEIGAGCLRNASFLQRAGMGVDVVEDARTTNTYAEEYSRFRGRGGLVYCGKWPKRRYDVIVCTFVLGVLPTVRGRLAMLVAIRKCLKRNGILLLSVRGPGDVKTKSRKGRRWRDGYVTPIGTFIKPFTRDEALSVAGAAGLVPAADAMDFRSNSGIVDLVLRGQA